MRGLELAAKLTNHLLQVIKVRGSRGGPLKPLADQLNHDEIHLQIKTLVDQDDLNRPVRDFLVNFDIYLQHLGSLQGQLALLPKGIWPIIDATAYTLAESFLDIREPLQQERPEQHMQAVDTRELFAFILKTAWIRGFFMYKFSKFDYIPAPVDSIDIPVIMESIVTPGDPTHPILAANIPVKLQRAASLLTEPKPVKASLEAIDPSLLHGVEEWIDEWSAKVRDAHGWGMLIAKAEEDHRSYNR